MIWALTLTIALVVVPEPGATELLARGESLFNDLEYELAAAEFMRAATAKDSTPQQRLRAHLLAGIANRIAGKDSDARLNFRNVLLVAPSTRLPDSAPPKVRTFFESVRQELEAEQERAAPPHVRETGGPDALPSTDASSSPARSITGEPGPALPPPDERSPSWVPWAVAGGAGVAAAGAGASWLISYALATAASYDLASSLSAYRDDPSADRRRTLVEAGQRSDKLSGNHNCVFVPLGCTCFPLAAVATGGAIWGIFDTAEEQEKP